MHPGFCVGQHCTALRMRALESRVPSASSPGQFLVCCPTLDFTQDSPFTLNHTGSCSRELVIFPEKKENLKIFALIASYLQCPLQSSSWNFSWMFGFHGGSVVKNPPANAGDSGSTPGSGRSPGEGNGSPLQYSYLGNPMDRGPWRATKSPLGLQRVRQD